MVEWSTVTVESCLERLTFGKIPKVLTRDYKPSGSYPIIDQGQSPIAGWTDDDRGLISTNLPVVIFGDHTRAFKYVDFPFVRGADGTQLLKPKAWIDSLFFYYACRTVDLPSRGYNRHFKALKEKEIPMPPPGEQRNIARILKRIDNTLSLQDEQFQAITNLKRATMRTIFTHGLRGEAQKETEIGPVPESWSVVNLGMLGRIGNGSTPKKANSAYWTDGSYPWLTSAKVYDREVAQADQFVTMRALSECHLPRVQPGAVLIAITGQGKTLGHCAVLRIESTLNQHLAYVALDQSRVDSVLVRGYLETQYDYLRQVGAGGGSTKGALTCGFLRDLPVPVPPMNEQREIAAILDAIDRKIDLHRKKRVVLVELFKVLLHKLMTGEIRVSDLDLSVLRKKSSYSQTHDD